MSMKTMKVAYVEHLIGAQGPHYRVLVIKNSTAYHPGQLLSKTEVDELCTFNSWDVTVVPYQSGGKQ